MNIIALLSWYDENPAWLGGVVSSLKGVADHVVAVDGAYGLYPRGRGRSERSQADAIRESARGGGMGCTVHEPAGKWYGNEVEKRDFMFRLAETVANPSVDWYFIIDGDETVTKCDYDIHHELATTPLDVAEATVWNYRAHYAPHERPFVSDMIEQFKLRMFFRAIPGLRVEGRHYHYVTPDGRYLWNDGEQEPCATFPEFRVEHRQRSRDLWRDRDRQTYYQKREQLQVEGAPLL